MRLRIKVPTSTINSAPASANRLAASVGKGAAFGVLASGAQVGTRFLTVPVVIHHLGLGGYGIWSIIMVTAAYMRFGTAGLKSAFQKYVAEATGNGDFETASKLVSTGSITMLALSATCLIPIAIFSRRLAVMSGVPQEFLSAAANSLTVLACIFVVSNFGAAYEAIVMGGHRVDLTKAYTTIFTVAEAIVIIGMLQLGYGLLAMTVVMGTSELLYILCCYLAAQRVVPQIHINIRNFRTNTFPELLRFAGSYQLVNILELMYGAILPIVFLRSFGAEASGIYALAGRVVTAALIAQDALVLPILSGGTMIFASGSQERAREFLAKSFKVTLASAILPLALAGALGPTMILAWTGQVDSRLSGATWLVALASLLRAISLLQLILYRASGKALLDNIRQVLRILAILLVAAFAGKIGFNGLLAGMALAELVGVAFMFFAMAKTFAAFSPREFLSDASRLSVASILIVCAGVLAATVSIPGISDARLGAALKLAEAGIASLIIAWPVLILTNSVSKTEMRALVTALTPRRARPATTAEQL